MDDLLFSPITELAAAVRSRRLSPVELTRAYLDRIAKLDPTLRAFITVDGDGALAAARALEREATAGAWRGPLHGVPLAHKDLCLIAGLPTSCGTRTADYFVGAPPCTAVARLVAAGAITLGKLNMTELRLGGGGGRGPGRGGARHRHRRLDPAARGVLRGGGAQGHLRPGEPRGCHAAVVVLRSRGPTRPHHPRRGVDAGGDRGPRSPRCHLEPPVGAGLSGRARRSRPGAARRRGRRLLRRASGRGGLDRARGSGGRAPGAGRRRRADDGAGSGADRRRVQQPDGSRGGRRGALAPPQGAAGRAAAGGARPAGPRPHRERLRVPAGPPSRNPRRRSPTPRPAHRPT